MTTKLINQPYSTIKDNKPTYEQLEKEVAELKDNWQELLIFAKDHDAGKYLYVEASAFIEKMDSLEGGE